MKFMAIDANATIRNLVEPHASSIESCATSMEAAGVGGGPHDGHVAVLRHMAGCMRAEAARGIVPSTYNGRGYSYTASKFNSVRGNGMEAMLYENGKPANLSAMKASAHYRGVEHLLRRHKISLDKTMTIAEFDGIIRAAMLPPGERIMLKSALSRAGLLT